MFISKSKIRKLIENIKIAENQLYKQQKDYEKQQKQLNKLKKENTKLKKELKNCTCEK